MEGLYGFLCWLEQKSAERKNIYLYQHNSGKKYFDFCVMYNLIAVDGINSYHEDVYGLTQRGKELVNSGDFNESLKRLIEEENKK